MHGDLLTQEARFFDYIKLPPARICFQIRAFAFSRGMFGTGIFYPDFKMFKKDFFFQDIFFSYFSLFNFLPAHYRGIEMGDIFLIRACTVNLQNSSFDVIFE